MELPIKFPNDADVIAEEVARFRALSPDQQVWQLNEMYRLGRFLMETSGRAAAIAALEAEEEAAERRAIEEFVARHGQP